MKKTALITLFFILFSSLFSQTPQRIVSLAPSLTKSLDHLEASHLLIGCTNYCHLAGNDHVEIVASAVSVNLEKVITLRPDLVLVTPITPPQTIEMIQKAGIKVEIFPTAKNFDEICQQFEFLGKLTKQDLIAKNIISNSREEVTRIKAAYKNIEPSRFFFQIGAKPLFTVLDNTFMDDFITYSGGVNIATGLSAGIISREFVLVSNPDVIIIVTMGIAGEEEKKIWENYTTLNAVKNNKIFFIDAEIATIPTPPDFVKTLQVINENLIE